MNMFSNYFQQLLVDCKACRISKKTFLQLVAAFFSAYIYENNQCEFRDVVENNISLLLRDILNGIIVFNPNVNIYSQLEVLVNDLNIPMCNYKYHYTDWRTNRYGGKYEQDFIGTISEKNKYLVVSEALKLLSAKTDEIRIAA